MKVFKPLVAFLILLVSLSIAIGLLAPGLVASLTYSPTLYLILCVAQAGHLLEENYTKAWEMEAQIRKNSDGVSGRDFFVMFSHVLVLLSFLFYFPIAAGASWALVFGIGVSLNGILNGVVHTAILAKLRKNTGFV
ncbi:MAG: hypothetical protein ACW992_13700 [Candidatus Thorarchaeota archaeon]|jgi:hypothetical protein